MTPIYLVIMLVTIGKLTSPGRFAYFLYPRCQTRYVDSSTHSGSAEGVSQGKVGPGRRVSLQTDLWEVVTNFLEKNDLIVFSESHRGVYSAVSHERCSACQDQLLTPQEVYDNHAAAAADENARLMVFNLEAVENAAEAVERGAVSENQVDDYADKLAYAVTLSGLSILSLAVLRGRKDVVNLLLKHRADPTYGGENAHLTSLDYIRSPFHRTDSAGDPVVIKAAVAMVETLLTHGATFTQKGPWDIILWTRRVDLICQAVRNGVDLLSLRWESQGVSLNPLSAILHHPALPEDKVRDEVLRAILEAAPRLMDITDNEGRTIIHQAVQAYWWNLAQALLRFPSTAWPIANDGQNALTTAIAHGKTKLIAGLLDRPEYEIDFLHDVDSMLLWRHVNRPTQESFPLMVAVAKAAEFPRALFTLATHPRMCIPAKMPDCLDVRHQALELGMEVGLSPRHVALIKAIPERWDYDEGQTYTRVE
ncbi:hypothetical protein ASPACDRAFT_1890042 [Aspergillus aculeatus ATCC 16872]|uniref:Uncharacterized protein n=1 Tax=Aspergillus aculeatus (strain ATCC 16872 / CBS 172.66 / WB 5094) TaxID=690307 RepID=A0A1L9WPQ8_ASPA1|nr:uncharacterized protein ASPACDRAFT_1890042 [Aspergillus aculeatus ATCC 16872]OJJ98158.1 hypothetical protein ASPACDRAFT_1890042 [Aspergillus aculeatus ATCC 16872]